MTAIGGSIEEVTMNGRSFSVAADADSNRNLGGFQNAIEANGDGSARIIKTRMPFKVDSLTVTIDDSNGDLEFLQDLADASDFFPITVTYASGETYEGSGQIQDELQVNTQAQTVSLTVCGPNKLTRQV